jgi:hypothetical protein
VGAAVEAAHVVWKVRSDHVSLAAPLDAVLLERTPLLPVEGQAEERGYRHISLVSVSHTYFANEINCYRSEGMPEELAGLTCRWRAVRPERGTHRSRSV